MNATMMLVCLAGSMTAAQPDKEVFKAPLIQVRSASRDKSEYLYVLYNRVYMGRNYQKPKEAKDRGNPKVDFSRMPTTYFHDKSPIGVVLQKYNWFPGKDNTYAADARLPASMIGMALDPWAQVVNLWSEPPIAVLGMDVATLAAYARPAQTFQFTERVPVFVKLSLPGKGEKRYFHYVQDALDRGANLKVFEGEPRTTIEKNGGENFYQAIVIETYKLPVSGIHKELLTKEALQMLMSKVREDGIVCYHTSNRYYEMAPIIAAAAKELKYACLVGEDTGQWDDDRDRSRFGSSWVMVARDEKHLAHLKAPDGNKNHRESPYWSAPRRIDKKFIWTDKGEQSFRGLYRSDPEIDKLHDTLYDLADVFRDKVGVSSDTLYRTLEPLHSLVRVWSSRSARTKNGGSLPFENQRDEPTERGDGVVFQSPRIQVKRFPDFQRGEDGARSYFTMLFNGINVGTNFRKPENLADHGNPKMDFSRLATTYFHREGPVGVVMERYNWFPGKPNTFHADTRLPASLIAATGLDPYGQLGQLVNLWSEPAIAVVEIDTGTMASYARPAQTLHFFESVPAMVRMSFPDEGKQPMFHYVPDALARGGNLKVFEGEARATLEKHGGAGFYQVIVINTYKLPVVTVQKDLMTKEGMQMLMSKTREDGILCFHTSSRYYDLVTIVASAAGDLKYACLVGHDVNDDHQRGHFTSEWVVVARKGEYLKHLKAPPGYDQAVMAKTGRADPFWSPPNRTDKKFIWTDKGENPFRGIYRADPMIGELGNALYELEGAIADRTGFQVNQYSRSFHDALNKWSIARAEVLNRDPPESKKTIDKKDAPKSKDEDAPKK